MFDGNGQKGFKWSVDLRIWMEAQCACDILHGTMELNIWKEKNHEQRENETKGKNTIKFRTNPWQ